MNNITVLSKLKKDSIKNYLRKKGVNNLSVFGSYARGEENSDSDLDLLINIDNGSSLDLFALQDIEDYLITKLHIKKIDFVTTRSINDNLKQHINNDLIKIY